MPRLPVLGALIVMGACSKTTLDEVRTNDRRVLLLGIDGLDYDIIKPIVDSGHVPRLAELRRRGLLVPIYGERANIDPYSLGLDPAQSWTTIATGFAPVHATEDGTSHGVRSITVPVAGSYDELPITSAHRQLPTFWQVLSAAGVRSAIVGWWTTWPAEPVDGALVSDRFFLEKFGLGSFGEAGRVDLPEMPASYRSGALHLTWPEELATTLPAEIEPALRTSGGPAFAALRELRAQARDAATATQLRQVEQALRTDLAVKEATLALLRKDPSIRFAACYFDAIDVATHWFWRHIDPGPWLQSKDREVRERAPTEGERRTYGNLVPLVVIAIDAMIAEITDAMGPETVVLLVSDHTLEPDVDPAYNRDFDLDRLLEQTGLLARAQDGSIDWSRTVCFDRTRWPRVIVRRLALNEKGVWPQGVLELGSPQERIVRWRAIQKQLQSVEARFKPASGPEITEIFMEYKFDEGDGGEAFFTVLPVVPSPWPVKLPAHDGVPARETTFGALFPLRRTAARHANGPGSLLVAYPGEAGERQGRRGIPMGKGPGQSRHVAPLVLGLFGIPCSRRQDESPPNADYLYWTMQPDEAQRMTLMPRLESYEAALRFRDPASELGRRRAELREYVASLGYELALGEGDPELAQE